VRDRASAKEIKENASKGECERGSALSGDAIDELFSRHYKVSLRTAYRILRSKDEHREVNMMDSPFAEEIKEVIVQLFRKDNTNEIEEWEALTPIELGVLSWHLGNFYYSPLW
jgi:hypothetical protein